MTKPLQRARPLSTQDVDLGLILRAKDGDFKAFESLVSKYQNRIFALAKRITGRAEDAEEVVQTSFLSIMEHLKDFRGDALFTTWLYRIAANHALKLVESRNRHAQRRVDVDPDESFEGISLPEFAAPWSASPEVLAGRTETRTILDKALGQLDEKHRTVFLMRDLQGLSTEETAEALDLTVANVKVRLMRARLFLREILTREFGDPKGALTGHDH